MATQSAEISALQNANRDTLLKVYVAAVTIIGMMILFVALNNLPVDRLGLLVFATLAGLSELFSVELFASSRSRVSVSSVIAIASFLVFGPLAGVITHMVSGVMTAVSTTFQSEQAEASRAPRLQRTLFNTSMWMIAIAVAGFAYVTLDGKVGDLLHWPNLVPLFVAVVLDALVNVVLLIGIVTIQTGRRPFEIWQRDFQWSAPINILVGFLGGGALAVAYQYFQIAGLMVFLLPVIATGYSFRLYVSNMKGYVVQLENLNATLDNANLGLLETLGATIDAYDVYTYGHSTQVAVYAGAIARCMDLSTEEQNLIVRAALVHDIGKIGIAESITSKPGRLTDEEYNIMRRHPIIGADILRRMEGLHALIPLVRHHHEAWDGTGYPAGLAEQEIPLGARVLAVADTLEAMCSDRLYRPRLPFEQVYEEITYLSGIKYDPAVVRAFKRLVKDQGVEFFENSAQVVDETVSHDRLYGILNNTRYLKRGLISENNPVHMP